MLRRFSNWKVESCDFFWPKINTVSYEQQQIKSFPLRFVICMKKPGGAKGIGTQPAVAQQRTMVISFPAALRKALVQRTLRGLRFILKFLWHFDLQKRKVFWSKERE